METPTPETPLTSLSRAVVDTAQSLAPGLVSLRAGRWRTTGFRFAEAGLLIAPAHAFEGVEEGLVSALDGRGEATAGASHENTADPTDGDVSGTTASASTGELRARVIGRDESLDLALLEVPGLDGALPWRDTPLHPGQLVIGLCRPADDLRVRLAQVVTVAGRSMTPLGGTLERTVELGWFGRNPLTTVIADDTGAAVGLALGGRRGWVLTTAMLERAVEQIRRLGRVRRGHLGILAQPVRLPAAHAPRKVGLLVTGVEEQSPASKGGVLLGDVLVNIAGASIDSVEDLWTALGPATVGTMVDLEVLRAGAARTVQVQVGARP